MFAWLGLIVTIAIWLGGAVLLGKWRGKGLSSISAHAASDTRANLLFRVVLIGGAILLYWWFLVWFVPNLELPVSFTVLVTFVMLYQVLTSLVTAKPGRSKAIHDYFAHTMALLYIPLAILISSSPELGIVPRVLCIGLTAYLVTTFILLEVMTTLRSKYLLLQGLYIVVFQVLILAAAYLPS